MPLITVPVDVLVHVIESPKTRRIGTYSPYYEDKVHPGTGKEIKGWEYDKRRWATDREIINSVIVATSWDPSLSAIPESWFQSGIGDNKDLLVTSIDKVATNNLLSVWAPQVLHGHYFIHDKDYYLHSDEFKTAYIESGNVESGLSFCDLDYTPRPGIPIIIRQYRYSYFENIYKTHLNFRRKQALTTSGTEHEFMVDADNFNPPRIYLGDFYTTNTIGAPLVLVSGIANPNDVLGLEQVGISDGVEFETFHATYSPIDPSATLEVWSYTDDITTPTQWTEVDSYDDFAVTGYDVLIDRHLGTLTFGSGLYPEEGSRIVVHYTPSVDISYEPNEIARDTVSALRSDINPFSAAKNRGFIQITKAHAGEAASITLTADAVEETTNEYSMQLGNNYTLLEATVLDQYDTPVEGQLVTFDLLDPVMGWFSGQVTSISALTDFEGVARAYYNTPPTINDVGIITDNVTLINGNTQTLFDIDGLLLPDTISGIYTYEIRKIDQILGIHENTLSGYYTDFLTEENIVSGINTDTKETLYRATNNLLRPTTYDSTKLRIGAKHILLTTRTIMDPHTGDFVTGFAPLHPITMTDTTVNNIPSAQLIFDTPLNVPSGPITKAYLVIGNNYTRVRAKTTMQSTNRVLYSNTIQINITLPESTNGTLYAETLNDIPSGLLSTVPTVELYLVVGFSLHPVY
jgi:hypothetical protein